MGRLIDKQDETIEVVLNDKEISELVNKLNELKQSEAHVHLDINFGDKKYLLIHHEEDELLKTKK